MVSINISALRGIFPTLKQHLSNGISGLFFQNIKTTRAIDVSRHLRFLNLSCRGTKVSNATIRTLGLFGDQRQMEALANQVNPCSGIFIVQKKPRQTEGFHSSSGFFNTKEKKSIVAIESFLSPSKPTSQHLDSR